MFIDRPCSEVKVSLDITYDIALLHIKAVEELGTGCFLVFVCVLQYAGYSWAVAVHNTTACIYTSIYLCPWVGFSWPESGGGGGWPLPTLGERLFWRKNTFCYKGDVKGNYPFIYAYPRIDFKNANLATSQRCWQTYKKDELYFSHDHIDPSTAADFWQVCFIRYDKCSPLKSACCKCKICQETCRKIGAEIRETGSPPFQSQRPTVTVSYDIGWLFYWLHILR
jgi:hypothetical protein